MGSAHSRRKHAGHTKSGNIRDVRIERIGRVTIYKRSRSRSRGDVFTDDVIETWIAYKRVNEVEAINLRPHPYEFYLYFDI